MVNVRVCPFEPGIGNVKDFGVVSVYGRLEDQSSRLVIVTAMGKAKVS
jgi:hypothetical protein